MSLDDHNPVQQQQSAAVPVGHSAPLRAKIAQFESKGPVPVPRGSFGMGAPPVPDKHKKGELYGNRMKPVWVPSAKAGGAQRTRRAEVAAAPTDWSRRYVPSLSRAVVGDKQGVARRADLMPPPDYPPAESVMGDIPSQTEDQATVLIEEPFEDAFGEEDGVASDHGADESNPTEDHSIGEQTPIISGEQLQEEVGDGDEEPLDEELSDEELSDEEPDYTAIHFTPDYSLPPPPPLLSSVHPPEPAPRAQGHPSLPPPLLEEPGDGDADGKELIHASRQYSTTTLESPPRASAASPCSPDSLAQGQTLSSVVYPRVRAPPAQVHEKLLPPTPPPKSPLFLSGDLVVLVEEAAALERRLLAGEQPADALRRLSVRPPPAGKIHVPVQELRVAHPSLDNTETTGKKTRHTHVFRNPLARRHKEELQSTGLEHGESKWFFEPAPAVASRSGWRKLANTTRLAGARKFPESSNTSQWLIPSS